MVFYIKALSEPTKKNENVEQNFLSFLPSNNDIYMYLAYNFALGEKNPLCDQLFKRNMHQTIQTKLKRVQVISVR